MSRPTIKAAFVLGFTLSLPVPVAADIVLTNDALLCPTIGDLSRFVETLTNPPGCIELPEGKRLAGPLDSGTGKWGDEQRTFYLVEVSGRRLWVPEGWAKVVERGRPAPATPALTVADSEVWFARTLRATFGSGLTLLGQPLEFEWLPCLTRDITKFSVEVSRGTEATVVTGTLQLEAIPSPFEVVAGAQGQQYLLHLQALLVSANGSIVWEQHGNPSGEAWVSSAGDTAEFRLIASPARSDQAARLIVIAIGEPILGASEAKVVLGAKVVDL